VVAALDASAEAERRCREHNAGTASRGGARIAHRGAASQACNSSVCPEQSLEVFAVLCRLRYGSPRTTVAAGPPHAALECHALESADLTGHGNFLTHCDRGATPNIYTTPRGRHYLPNLPDRSIGYWFLFCCRRACSLTRIVHHVFTHHLPALPEHPRRLI
jgi:hypothetical protein